MRGQPLSDEMKERMAEGRRRYWDNRAAEPAAAIPPEGSMKTQAETDAEFLVDWLKTQATWAIDNRPHVAMDAANRRYYEAFLVMSEEHWRLFVIASLLQRVPRLPRLPAIERKIEAA